MTDIARAAAFAGEAHLGQTRKGKDVPYVVHPARVAAYLEVHYPDQPELAVAAMLHDTIEDCDVTRGDIVEHFGERVAALVWAVTNGPAGFRPTDDPDVLRIKAADLYDNMSETLRDIRAGVDVWTRFKAGSGKALRWRHYLNHVLDVIGDEPLPQRADRVLREIEAVMPEPPKGTYATPTGPWVAAGHDVITSMGRTFRDPYFAKPEHNE